MATNKIIKRHMTPLWTSTGAAQLEPLPFGAARGQMWFLASGAQAKGAPTGGRGDHTPRATTYCVF